MRQRRPKPSERLIGRWKVLPSGKIRIRVRLIEKLVSRKEAGLEERKPVIRRKPWREGQPAWLPESLANERYVKANERYVKAEEPQTAKVKRVRAGERLPERKRPEPWREHAIGRLDQRVSGRWMRKRSRQLDKERQIPGRIGDQGSILTRGP